MMNALNKTISRLSAVIFGIGAALALSGCLSDGNLGHGNDSSTNDGLTDSYIGCVSGTGLDSARISITFEFPEAAEKVHVYRNGNKVFSSSDHNTTSFIDMGLLEGAEYEYSCEMERSQKTKVGSQIITVATISSTPPNFAGILTAVAANAHQVNLTWAVPSSSGALAKYYQIYANPGSTVDWTKTPRLTANSGTNATSITNLGDQLTYAFGVRACNVSDVCDTNTVQKTVTLDDDGPPTTTGIQSYVAQNGSVDLVVPWADNNGLISKRKVYSKTGGSAPVSISDMSLARTEVVSDPIAPVTTITIPGLADNTTYYYLVRDEDSIGQANTNFNYITVNSGDMTPPTFTGITALNFGSTPQNSLIASFNAIDREGIEGSDGASSYEIYTLSAAYPTTPGSACTGGTLYTSVAAYLYPPGVSNITLTGLSERTNYSVCIKAKDASGNTSSTTAYLVKNTTDVTSPTFDGIQTVSFSSTTSQITIGWNTSTSSDVSVYKVSLWKNTANPTSSQITVISKTASSNQTGFSFGQSTFSFTNSDRVYAMVNSCDDASTVPGSSQNCNTYGTASAKSVLLPQFEPPQGFPGIKSSTDQSSPAQGQATLTWGAPSSWTSDYYGFRIYQVNPSTNALGSLLKTCVCATPGACTNSDTSCTLTGLDANRTYRFHVRAINSASYETTYLDPAISYADLKVIDTEAPNFNSGLSVGTAPSYILTWNQATDNQYTGDGAVVKYEIYRKVGSNFTTTTQPYDESSPLSTTTDLTYTPGGLSDGLAYYFTLCAVDDSSNRKCDGTVAQFTTTDTTPPSLTNITTTKSDPKSPLKSWSISWSMSDAVTPTASLRVQIFRSSTDTPSTATTVDSQIFNQLGATTATGLMGPTGVRKFLNYLIVLTDQVGNQSTATLTVLSDNRLTLTASKRSTGLVAGSEWIVVEGTGFSKSSNNGLSSSTTLLINNATCTNLVVVSSERLYCQTPSGSAGGATLKVTNPDGTSTTQTGLFSYVSTSSEICDNSGSWGSEMATGTGTSSNPFVICNETQLRLLQKTTSDGASLNYRTNNYYFKLGAHIKFSGTVDSITKNTLTLAQFDGDGYSLIAFANDSTISGSRCTVFYAVTGTNVVFKNLKILNETLTCVNSGIVGGLIGQYSESSNLTLDTIEVYGQTSLDLVSTQCGSSCFVGIFASAPSSYTSSSVITYKNLKADMSFTIPSTTTAGTIAIALLGRFTGSVEVSNVQMKATISNSRDENSDYLYVMPYSHPYSSGVTVQYSNIDADITSNGMGYSYFANFSPNATAPASDTTLQNIYAHLVFNTAMTNTQTDLKAKVFWANHATGGSYSNITMNKVGFNVDIFEKDNSSGVSQGTFLNLSNISTTDFGTYSISDAYLIGTNHTTYQSLGSLNINLNTTTSALTMNRFYQSLKFPSATPNTYFIKKSGSYGVSLTNLLWDYSTAGVTASDGGNYSTGITGASSTEMTDTATGNIYESNGYDFNTTSGAWKWCDAYSHPRLSFETCP